MEEVRQVDDQERDGVMEHLCTVACNPRIPFAAEMSAVRGGVGGR
ncbi:hypothetical protein PVAP13_1KG120077 [Panicum virgatum]|uniref:Uncharacterized protein n=1 Tax=Panicum virgatum TaxID=38727 RepID=A0A8T0X5N9_PANVG|nr:hypothetical protein PVAP13_1KG120077 [Panicum virgatum]